MARKRIDLDQMVQALFKGDRVALGKALTLIESAFSADRKLAARLLEMVLPRTGRSVRLGITGVPGAGKSTLIETLGMLLISLGKKVAVLSVDPSSRYSKGSILADKTRMQRLSRESGAFIRPSSSGEHLGGIAISTGEAMQVCEAAGYDVIIIETVGVGQSETQISSLVDIFVLVVLTGAGDELQFIKRGIMEVADIIAINKAEDANLQAANSLKQELLEAGKTKRKNGLPMDVVLVSALNNIGVSALWENIVAKTEQLKKNGYLLTNRSEQEIQRMHIIVNRLLQEQFYDDVRIRNFIYKYETDVMEGRMPSISAAMKLLDIFVGRSTN